MTQIQLDAVLANKLHAVGQVVELCDPTGRVLGRFVPTLDESEWEPVTPEVSEAELDQIEKSSEWYTFEQVMEHLNRLENQ